MRPLSPCAITRSTRGFWEWRPWKLLPATRPTLPSCCARSLNAGAELISQKVAINYDVFFEQVPLEHLNFFNTLELYYRSDDVVCVHGGVDPTGSPLHLQNSDTLLWGPDNFPDAYRERDAIVYGHWDNSFDDESGWPLPCIKDNRTFGIDTISRGGLTAMRFPDGEIFQSKKYPSTNRNF